MRLQKNAGSFQKQTLFPSINRMFAFVQSGSQDPQKSERNFNIVRFNTERKKREMFKKPGSADLRFFIKQWTDNTRTLSGPISKIIKIILERLNFLAITVKKNSHIRPVIDDKTGTGKNLTEPVSFTFGLSALGNVDGDPAVSFQIKIGPNMTAVVIGVNARPFTC